MAITPDQLNEAADIVARSDSVRAAAAQLRARFAPLRALVVDADDLRGETPVREVALEQGGARALHLMATDGHCWVVTQDPCQASALVLSQA